MFTGIITNLGTLEATQKKGALACSWLIQPRPAFGDAYVLGESISISGTCLTVTGVEGDSFWVDISEETLACTCLGSKKSGDCLNLERALKVGDRMGGHFVTGHVDCVGSVVKLEKKDDFVEASLRLPLRAKPFLAPKGSLSVDGVSLTVNQVEVDPQGVTVFMMWIPHTLEKTTFHTLLPGGHVNIEFDIVARYIAQNLESYGFHKKSN